MTDTPNDTTLTSRGTSADRSDRWWETTWPLVRADWLRLAIALVTVVAAGVTIGELLTNWSVLNPVVELDENIARDLADGRTSAVNDLAHWSAAIADTPVKIALSILIAGLFLWRFRRWHEAVMVGLPLIFEATAFMSTTYIVARPRPDVERLLESPVDSSFPSGHVAAATVYAALAVIVFWHTRAIWARALAVVLAAAAALLVAWARAYQGMHYFTDVVAGMILGVVSIAIAVWILGPPPDAVGSETASAHAGAARGDTGPGDSGRGDEVAA